MSQFKQMFNSYRSKRQASRRQGPRPAARQAGDNLDLGDRLVEKLAEQKRHMEEKIGNMTCVLKEINALDASNNIDIQGMKRDAQKYTMMMRRMKMKDMMRSNYQNEYDMNEFFN